MLILAGENSSEATLKFSSRNKKEDKSKKPRSKENIALPSEEETATRDRGEATATTDMYRQLYLRYFFPASVFNSIPFFLIQRDKIPQLQCQRRSFAKIPPIRNGFTTKATRRGSVFLKVCSRNSACASRCNDRQQELHDL